MASKTRLFSLTWNNAKKPNQDAFERFRERNTVGVEFHNGLIALSSGAGFNSMDELKKIIKPYGNPTITYLDGSSVEVKEDDHAQAS